MGNGWLFTAAGLCDVADGTLGGGGGGTEEVWGCLEGGDEWEDCMMDGWGLGMGGEDGLVFVFVDYKLDIMSTDVPTI